MKNKIGDKARLHHIFDAILEIENYTKNKSYNDYFSNSMLQSACVRQLEIIGEAASKVSHETKIESINTQWQEITGLRNILIHEYFGVDLDIVWEIIQTDIPHFKIQIQNLLDELSH